MSNRVDQIALYVRKLAHATGVRPEKDGSKDPSHDGVTPNSAREAPSGSKDPSLDGVTSDLDIEALSKGLLDISRDLDLFLQGLLDPPNLPVASLKADIAALEKELQEKDDLFEKSLDMVRKAEATFRKVKQRGNRNIYQL